MEVVKMKLEDFENMTREELEEFLNEEELNEEKEIIIASIELGKRDKAEGKYYSTEEVLEHIFGKNRMVY